MLQRSQMLALPVSGLGWGLLNSLLYERALGATLAWLAGWALAIVLCLVAGWVAYRSDGAARHRMGNSLLYLLAMAPFVGGACLVLAQMTRLDAWIIAAWTVGVMTVIAPVLGPALQTRARLVAEGETGPWARTHLDLRKGILMPDAFGAVEPPRSAMTPWQIGALAVNLPLVWRLMGGGDTSLLALAMIVMSATLVWVGVKQVGPALGAAWFVLDIERRTGQRLRNPEWAEVQAMRRSHWLARWFMRDA